MRLAVTHETTYRYGLPAMGAIQTLRLSPRGHDGQYVLDWRIELDHDVRMRAATDAFGNTVHSFTLAGPIDGLVITATGVVETEDTNGIVRGQVECFPPVVFLRDTDLTRSDAAIRDLAVRVAAAGDEPLALLHRLAAAVRDHMTFDTGPTDARTTAIEAFSHGHGVCQDFAHVFIAAARHLGIPARYVGGYLFKIDAPIDQEAGHGWAEALAPDLGWIGLDPTNGISATDGYVRVAIGLDYLGAAPVRGTRYGGADETLSVKVRVEEGGRGRR